MNIHSTQENACKEREGEEEKEEKEAITFLAGTCVRLRMDVGTDEPAKVVSEHQAH